MSAELHAYVLLVLVGFLPNEIWRMLGLVVARGIDEDSELFMWARAVATAVLAGVIAKIILFPPGTLASVPLVIRLAAIVCGFAEYKKQPVCVAGHQKGSDTKQKIFRNFGYARPEGYRKALRVMQLSEKFKRPIVVFIDTPAAYPGVESEERGVAEAIALNLREMMMLEVPIVIIVCGEGGSGGALGIAIGDRVLMHENAIYSVIPPEGCAAILWRDANRKVEAAEALKITAPDLLQLGIIDEIVSEPVGGAHQNPAQAAALLDVALDRALSQESATDVEARLESRYQKFRAMGQIGIESPA